MSSPRRPTGRGARRWAVLLAAVAVAATACGSAAPESRGSADVGRFDAFDSVVPDPAAASKLPARITQAGKLVVVMNASSAPVEFYADDNKTIIGLNADLARAIGRTLGVPTEIQDVQIDGIIPGLMAKRFDMAIASMAATTERLKALDMVRYGEWGNSLAVAEGNPLKLTPQTLCGHKIAVEQGSIQEARRLPELSAAQCDATGRPEVQAVVLPSQTDAVLQLGSGRVDGVLGDTPVIGYAAAQTPDKFQVVAELNRGAVAVGLARGSDLTPAVQAAIQSLMTTGTYQRIFAKWGMAGAVTATPSLEG
ncbi:ABC transporter substrate-binding protein [Pseudonocardia spinosispora]|uniref:ABC transporter substrate-binding protein n=1 Tax=Pseudonocardia spinosispora TaxID=103441 RepID=UPI0004019739|nr:ABC transporter substrate-binding protein [Pseudonocardia spinosispora]